MRLTAGTHARLGASWDGRGTNFALFSANAEKVELCLFDGQGRRELERIELPERTEDVWHGYLNDVSPGQLYGYRVLRPLRARAGPPLQRQQAAARSLCQAARRPAGLERCAFRLPHRQRARGSVVRPPRQCARHAQGRRGRRDLQLGPPRDPAEHSLGRHHHLRGPRQGPDAEARRRAAEFARHLWRPRLAGDDRAFQAARRHHDRAAADPCA